MSRRRLELSTRLARFLAFATVASLAFFARPSDARAPPTRFDALPRASERLQEPDTWLPHCKMRIVEWRPTAALRAETTMSEQALQVMDDTCQNAFGRYAEFLRARRLPRLRGEPDVLPTISLDPGNTLLDGKSPRALNDLPTRFEAVAPGMLLLGSLRRSAHESVRPQRPPHQERQRRAGGEPAVRAHAHSRDLARAEALGSASGTSWETIANGTKTSPKTSSPSWGCAFPPRARPRTSRCTADVLPGRTRRLSQPPIARRPPPWHRPAPRPIPAHNARPVARVRGRPRERAP